MYLPAFNVTEVPLDEPENDFGEGLLPAILMVKSEGFFVPPLTFVVTVKNVFEPIGVVELFDVAEPPPLPFEEDGVDEDDEEEVLFSGFFAAA